jgi:histidinol-phosphate aminotransferase
VTGGIVTPEVQAAIDKGGLSCVETSGSSPFSSDIDAVLAAITDPSHTVFVSNPNRITGTDWSLSDLEEIANAIPDGLLIVDEFYHDYYGISADPLLTQYTNIVILRSPAPALGFPGSCGYLIASPYLIDRLTQARALGISSDFELATLNECLYDTERLYERLRTLHEEALRMVGEMGRLGFQSRLTPFDKLLVKVASPAIAGNLLSQHKIEVENFDGYPGMKHQIRIAIDTPDQNSRTIEAFRVLSQNGVTSRRPSRRMLELKRTPEQAEIDALNLPPTRTERVKAFVSQEGDSHKAVVK